jgi:hypothetical protein
MVTGYNGVMAGLVLALAAAAAIPDARDTRRVLSANGCARCHDSGLATAKPAALAVFDLRDEAWGTRMSESQLRAMLGRLRSAPRGDREIVRRFVDAELARRRQPGLPAGGGVEGGGGVEAGAVNFTAQ